MRTMFLQTSALGRKVAAAVVALALLAAPLVPAEATLQSQIAVHIQAALAKALDQGAAAFPLDYTYRKDLATGVGTDQADKLYAKTHVLTAAAFVDLDVAGVLLDGLGDVVTMVKVKMILVRAAASNTNTCDVGGAASNALLNWVGAATHTVKVRPGGILLLAAPDNAAYGVTAGTGDLLRVTNGGGGTSVSCDVIILGTSS